MYRFSAFRTEGRGSRAVVKTKREMWARKTINTIRRKARRKYSVEEKICIVVEGLKGEDTIAELCRREGISESVYYSWSKQFLWQGTIRVFGDHVGKQTWRINLKWMKELIEGIEPRIKKPTPLPQV